MWEGPWVQGPGLGEMWKEEEDAEYGEGESNDYQTYT